MKRARFTAGIDLRAADANKPRRFRIEAYGGGPLIVGGFRLPVVIDLRGLQAAKHVPILLNHEEETDSTLGQADEILNDGRSLSLEGGVTGVSRRVLDVLAAADKGHRWEASVGCEVHESRDIPAGQFVLVNGQQQKGPFTLATRSTLHETSVLPKGADGNTSVNLAAAAASMKGNSMDFSTWLTAMGVDEGKLTATGKAAMMQSFSAEQGGNSPPPDVASVASEMRAAAIRENKKIAAIRAAASGHPDVLQTALESDWTPEQTELYILRAGRAKPGFVSAGASDMDQKKILTASLALSAGCRPEVLAKSRDMGERVVDAAMSLEHRGASLHRLMAEAYHQAGVRPPSSVVGDTYIRGAFECSRTLRASTTTMSMPGILSDVANKLLLDGFQSIVATWKNFCAITTSPNFKPAKRYRMVTGNKFESVPSSGELEHFGMMTEEEYSNQLKTYGCMAIVDRHNLINDDLGAFSKLLAEMGRHGMMKLERSVYELLFAAIAAGTFFTVPRGNLLTGAGSALDIEALTAAVAAFDGMIDANGEALDPF